MPLPPEKNTTLGIIVILSATHRTNRPKLPGSQTESNTGEISLPLPPFLGAGRVSAMQSVQSEYGAARLTLKSGSRHLPVLVVPFFQKTDDRDDHRQCQDTDDHDDYNKYLKAKFPQHR